MATKRLPALVSDLLPVGFFSTNIRTTATAIATTQKGANSGVLELDPSGRALIADMPATGVIVMRWDDLTGWPARSSARTDVTGWWVCPTGTANPPGAVINDRVIYYDPIGPVALFARAAFGARAENTSGATDVERYQSLETRIGAAGNFKRFTTYQDMLSGGASGWPTTQATWAASTGHDLDIAWDMVGYPGTFVGLAAGDNNATLDAFATAAKAFPGTVVLRMWWEMNISPGPTKISSGTTLFTSTDKATRIAQWLAAWRYVYTRIRVTNAATNVRFLWCPNGTDSGGATNATAAELWPGDDYVDEIGFDTYEETTFEGWHGFDGRMAAPMAMLAAATGNSQKPISIGELGCDALFSGGQTRADFVRQMFTSTKWPNLKHVSWYDSGRWALDSASLDIYRQYLSTL